MESNLYSKLCSEIHEHLFEDKLHMREDENLRFATRGTAKEVLHDDILRRFFRSVTSHGITAKVQFGIEEGTFTEKIKSRDLYDFLAVLTFATCSIEAARLFVTKLVATEPWKEDDRVALPASRWELEELFENKADADRFSGKQACFCPVVLHERKEVSVKNSEYQRLPYISEPRPLGEGSVGKVFRVKIAKGHFSYLDPVANRFKYNDQPMEMARKDYVVSDKFPVRHEREILERISNLALNCENIVRHFGSFEIDMKTYSLFMPAAICDLKAYMDSVSPTKPATTEAKIEIMDSARGLAVGLNFLHNGMRSDTEKLVCYHMDLKPDNVLIFRDVNDRHIWKLSDFGMSRVKIRHQNLGTERESDFRPWFIQRHKLEATSASPTFPRRAEGSYLAPETARPVRGMTTKGDVWSLGCVLSVVFAYLEGGRKGTADYQAARRDPDEGWCRFFVRQRWFQTTSEIHPAVKEWHAQLVKKATDRNRREGEIVKDVLKKLESCTLEIEPSGRCGAEDVLTIMEKVLTNYRRLQEDSSNPNESSGVPPSDSGPTPKVDNRLYLSSSEAFKGCAFSPDATRIAYWTDTKMILYSADTLKESPGNEETPSARYSLDQTDGFWKNAIFTSEHLIAFTTGKNECYIFDIAGAYPEFTLNQFERVVLSGSELHKVAVSPNSKLFACVLQNQEGAKSPASIMHVSVRALIRWSKNNAIKDPPWDVLPVEWSAADIIHLTISDSRDIHLVVRPQIKGARRANEIPIVWVSIEKRKIYTLSIRSESLDSSGMVNFFTAFCPFSTDTACAVVTHEKRLLIQTFHRTDKPSDFQMNISNYRVLKLMVSSDDSKIYVLGTESASQEVLLLRMTMPRNVADKQVEKLDTLSGLSYSDDFTARFFDQGEGSFVLVASLLVARNNSRTVYKIKIPGKEGQIL